MSCRTETIEIGERTYSVTQWPAATALKMQLRLMKAFGPGLAALLNVEVAKAGGIPVDELSSAIAKLFESNSVDAMVELLTECIYSAAVNGERINAATFAEIFSGDALGDSYRVFFFVVKVNFGNLIKSQKLKSVLDGLQEGK